MVVHTRNMAYFLRQVRRHVQRINRRHRRIMNPAYRFHQGPAPQGQDLQDFIQLEINNVETDEIQYVHFLENVPIARFIDLTED